MSFSGEQIQKNMKPSLVNTDSNKIFRELKYPLYRGFWIGSSEVLRQYQGKFIWYFRLCMFRLVKKYMFKNDYIVHGVPNVLQVQLPIV